MSLSLDKLRRLRRQAGDATPAPARDPAAATAGPVAATAVAERGSAGPGPSTGPLPPAANDARAKVDSTVAAEMAKLTGGLQLPPGLKLPF